MNPQNEEDDGSITFSLSKNRPSKYQEVEEDGSITFSLRGEKKEEKKTTPKDIARTVVQAPIGYGMAAAMRRVPILGALELLKAGTGAEAEMELRDILAQEEAERGFPFTQEEIQQRLQQFRQGTAPFTEYFPAPSTLEKVIEEQTGFQTQPQSDIERYLRIGGMGAGFQPGTLPVQAISGGIAGGGTAALEELGVPKEVSSFAPLLLAGNLPQRVFTQKVSPITQRGMPGAPKGPPSPPSLPPGPSTGGIRPPVPKGPPPLPPAEEFTNIPYSKIKEIPTPKPIFSSKSSPQFIATLKKEATPLGITVKAPEKILTKQEQVGNLFFPGKFKNTTMGGRSIQNTVRKADKEVYQQVNKLYDVSKNLQRNISDIHPELIEKLDTRLNELNKISEPSTVQKSLMKAIGSIKRDLGDFGAYKEISNQSLIDQIQSLNQTVDFDFAHGDARNIFKPLIRDLQVAVEKSSERASPKALEAYNAAKNAYKEWADIFDNPYVRPLRDTTNKDYTKIYKSALDIDEFNQLKKALEKTKRGDIIKSAVLRDLVESKVEPFTKQLGIDVKKLEKVINELEAVAPKKLVREARNVILQKSPLASRIGGRKVTMETIETLIRQKTNISNGELIKKLAYIIFKIARLPTKDPIGMMETVIDLMQPKNIETLSSVAKNVSIGKLSDKEALNLYSYIKSKKK